MLIKELRELAFDGLQKELRASLREQFNLRMQKGTGQLSKPHLLRQVRRKIARIKTVMNEKVGKKS